METIEINMLMDPVCPWCYIGKERLKKAMLERPQYNFSLQYSPFQLNPDMPPGGMSRRRYLDEKFGGRDAADHAYAPVRKAAEALELGFRLEAIDIMPNSTAAHTLLQYLRHGGYNKSSDYFLQSLFRAFFCDGRNIGNLVVLQSLWKQLPDDLPNAEKIINDSALHDYIQDAQKTAYEVQIGGVPFYIIGGKYSLSGAQEPQMFLPIFDLAAQDMS